MSVISYLMEQSIEHDVKVFYNFASRIVLIKASDTAMVVNVITSIGVILLLPFSHAGGYKCLNCMYVARPQDCDIVTSCGPHQKCFIQVLASTTHSVMYNLGCLDDTKCPVSQGNKRDDMLASKIKEHPDNDVARDIDSQSDSTNTFIAICTSCCNSELCNIKGCAAPGLPVESGPVCYNCNQMADPHNCNSIAYCSRDEACHLSTGIIGVDQVYKSGCIQRQICQNLGILDTGASLLIGRRQRDVDMSIKFKRWNVCNKCCTANLCNFGNCSSSIHPSNPPPQITTLAPVNGGWSAWSNWNLCSVTCGEGSHSRLRVCNNPHPTHGGAMCSGPNKETNYCRQPICPANGQWSLWTMWSVCSRTCGTGGTHYRQRTCDNPPPTSGGKGCVGQPYESQRCDGLSDPQLIQTTHNFTRPVGSNIVINCLVPGSSSQQQVPRIQWFTPQIIGHEFPLNVEEAADGTLYIIGLTVENTGPYYCQTITACGIFNSAQFWVNIQ